MGGRVTVGGLSADKAGSMVSCDADVEVLEDLPYVSRGGLKLAAALDAFGVDCAESVCMDIGASTGGFTDCLLQRGAARVFAVDVGYGQLDWKFRNDPRVVMMEKTNIRHMDRTAIEAEISLIVIDVSFISLRLVLPKAAEFLAGRGTIMALIKPQFEVGKGEVGKNGIVRDEEKRRRVVVEIEEFAASIGLVSCGVIESPIRGARGNVEYLICLKRVANG